MPDTTSHQAKAAQSRPGPRTGMSRRLSHGARDFTVVAIGASAGGLEACTALMDAVPSGTGMAFILVQHLDPTHESMMAGLLAGHTALTVREAADGMPIEREHLYVIAAGAYLSVGAGALRLSRPDARHGGRHGARLPFDVLLRSLAVEYGVRAACVILSGTGADGSLGLAAVKEKGGLVLVQDPKEAGYDGMPRSAIATGAVDAVLPVAEIPDALLHHDRRTVDVRAARGPPGQTPDAAGDRLSDIIELLRTNTAHDFSLYKRGTLQRRVERRMQVAGIDLPGMDAYLAMLRDDPAELETLAKSLLINVTSFFRDAKVFDLLTRTVVPELVHAQAPGQPLRIWVAGCSTGEETYSLAMLFREAIAATQSDVKLQLFASDVDPDAVAVAREGIYPDTIEADVSAARLARFFSKEDSGYRVLPELRGAVIFAVQDILTDPPFSRIDLVSCRNLLIYLGPEAQAKAVSLFHFALREGGVLLLGSAERPGNVDGRFELISKAERLYRHVGRSRPGALGFSLAAVDGAQTKVTPASGRGPSRQTVLADLGRRLVLEAYAPAAVLVNGKNDCLFSLGPTDRYLRMAPGLPTHDLLAMARQGLRAKLGAAIQQAAREKRRVVVQGGRVNQDGPATSFRIEVQPVQSVGEELLLVCFVEDTAPGPQGRAVPAGPVPARHAPGVADLERELDAARGELRGALRDLDLSNEEQNAINEEALSVNEEYQSANEELLTSKEELQSLNEELTALNSQLQETLEQQRTTSDDLQNVLYSTDVATLFLDTRLNIRFFTPATKSLFAVIPSDLGRPLADLQSFAQGGNGDGALADDARTVLLNLLPLEREIEAPNDAWFTRRILPYRVGGGGVEGVVITFTDITERKQAAKALEAAKQQAELANTAKSRFLAAASHDLRQPLQTLTLLQGLLARTVTGEKAVGLVARLDDTLDAMSGMLNTLLDINQIESGIVRAEPVTFTPGGLFDRLRDEFAYQAQAKGLALRVVPCGLPVYSDPRLLEQIIRNLLSNALKYTARGTVLLGCRRRAGRVSIEIWDTGLGIPDEQLGAIFEEYHQVGNAARERSRGLGLGLSIVRRLATLLDHRVHVRSRLGKGSVFSIEVPRPQADTAPPPGTSPPDPVDGVAADRHRTGTVLAIEDDPELREQLQLALHEEGHRVSAASDGPAALDLVAHGTVRPDLILADYNIPGSPSGLTLAMQLRERIGRTVPVIILTGDISTDTLRDIARHDCVQLNKPVKMTELTRVIQRLLPATRPAAQPAIAARLPQVDSVADGAGPPVIFIVDDDSGVCGAIRSVVEEDGGLARIYATGEAFLDAYRPGGEACLLIDAYLPGMNGLDLLRKLREAGHDLPAIMITGRSDVPMAVQAMKAGASDFIEKPIGRGELLAGIARALEQSRDSGKVLAWRESAASHVTALSPRQRQIMALVLDGHPNKNIAADLGLSQRTVENHRASIMRKTGSKSLPALARLALAAGWADSEGPLIPGGPHS